MARKSDTWSSQVVAFFRDIDQVLHDPDFSYIAPLQQPVGQNYRVRQDKGCTTIDLQVPGCAPANVDLTLEGGIITVIATPGGGLSRTVNKFRVGTRVRAEDIKATVLHGILTIEATNGEPPVPQGKIPVT